MEYEHLLAGHRWAALEYAVINSIMRNDRQTTANARTISPVSCLCSQSVSLPQRPKRSASIMAVTVATRNQKQSFRTGGLYKSLQTSLDSPPRQYLMKTFFCLVFHFWGYRGRKRHQGRSLLYFSRFSARSDCWPRRSCPGTATRAPATFDALDSITREDCKI